MELVKEDFKDRVREIEYYLRAIEQTESENFVTYKINKTQKTKIKVPTDLPKIMKATFFLLLYNLVESTVRLSFAELYNKIEKSELPLKSFKPEYTSIWITQKFRATKATSSNQDTYRKLVTTMIEEFTKEASFKPALKYLDISGNIDAKKARELLAKHAIGARIHYKANKGAELRTIKDKRNALAHGDISFSECGREYTPEDLKKLKSETVTFLKSIMRNIEKFIENSEYAA